MIPFQLKSRNMQISYCKQTNKTGKMTAFHKLIIDGNSMKLFKIHEL